MVEFDPKKAGANLEKHGIDFTDVEPVFYDENAYTTTVTVETQLGPETRHVTTGMDALGRLITVVWTSRGSNQRLISARHPRKEEREHYERH